MRRATILVLAAALALPAAARGFEGTVKLRSLSVPRDRLAQVTGGAAAPDTKAILAIQPAELLAATDAGVSVHEGVVYVSGGKVRMDLPLERGAGGYAIVDTARDTTWFVVPSDKKYIEWSEADAKAMGDKMEKVEKMMKERMASLPPAQRKQVEAMMKNLKGGDAKAPAAKVALEPLDETRTINGMTASGYETQSGDLKMVGWVTTDQPALAAALRTVQERMQKMTPARMRGRETARKLLGEKGFPVMVQTIDPQSYRVEEVLSVQAGAVDPKLFTVPEDYAKTTGRDALRAIPEK